MDFKFSEIGEQLNRIRESDGLEVLAGNSQISFLRFANSVFHQHIASDIGALVARSRYGKKTGQTITTDLRRDALVKALRESEHIAKVSPERLSLPPLMEPDKNSHFSLSSFVDELSPEKKADILKRIFNHFPEFKFYGVFFNFRTEHQLFHSTGFELSSGFNEAQLNLLAVDEKNRNSVWVQRSIRKPSDLDTENIIDTIARKLSFKEPETLPKGEYTVILEPVALFDLLHYMVYIAFSGNAHVDGYSPLRGRLGEKVFSSYLTLVDDPDDESLLPVKYDAEGIKKSVMTFVEDGVFKNIAYDRETAIKANTVSTGHAVGPFGGILVSHLKMKEGRKDIEELIEETDRGILITRFHYINIVDMQRLVFTGMTRDGTFFIEKGKIRKPLTNMRFNVSLFDILSEENLTVGKGTQDVGMSEMYESRYPLRFRLPPVKVNRFTFIQS